MKLQKWMSEIEDSRDVFSLNILGTHDCVTKYVQLSHISRCQDMDIFEQLEIGIRALDIRVECSGERLKMIHGPAKVFNEPNPFSPQMDLSDVLEKCFAFLDENKSETIIFQFKNDSGKEYEKSFDILFNVYIKGMEDRWFLENRIPLMGEARGKIILIRRCKMYGKAEYTDKNTGIDFSRWEEQETKEPHPLPLKTGGAHSADFIIQDRYKYTPEPRWKEVIEPMLDSMKPFDGEYVINYLSTAGGIKGPHSNSKYINPKFMNYPLKQGVYYGTIYADFPTAEMAEKLIKQSLAKSK